MFSEVGTNVASIQSLQMVEHTGVSDTLAITGTAIVIPFAPDQASLEIIPATSKNGGVYSYILKASIPRVQFTIKTIAETLYKRYVFFCTDNNGNVYTIGKRNKGYKIDISGSITSDINTMTFGFTAVSSQTFEIA